MRFARAVWLISTVLVLCVLASACAGSAVSAVSHGCQEEVWEGVPGMVHPETSGLTCDAIKELIEVRPSEPESFLVQGAHLQWKCRLNSPQGHTALLRCAHHRKHFSIVKRGSGIQ
jgi:hypothetical protein